MCNDGLSRVQRFLTRLHQCRSRHFRGRPASQECPARTGRGLASGDASTSRSAGAAPWVRGAVELHGPRALSSLAMACVSVPSTAARSRDQAPGGLSLISRTGSWNSAMHACSSSKPGRRRPPLLRHGRRCHWPSPGAGPTAPRGRPLRAAPEGRLPALGGDRCRAARSGARSAWVIGTGNHSVRCTPGRGARQGCTGRAPRSRRPGYPQAMIASNSARSHSSSAQTRSQNASSGVTVTRSEVAAASRTSITCGGSQALIACRSAVAVEISSDPRVVGWEVSVTAILRGLASSATGMRSVSTPAS